MITALFGCALAGTVRFGLFVGANTGMGDEPRLSYAEGEAREMSRVFQDMGSFDRDRVTVLQGPTANELREAMREVEAAIRDTRSGDDVLLVFYYSGHAARDGLHLEGSALPLEDVRRWLEGSTAQVRVAFVDACESGALARGGAPADVVEVTVDDTLTSSGVAIVTSTGPISAARESSDFGGGVFSRALLSGLRGSADADDDGIITLDEAYRYAFEATVVGTASSGTGVQRPEYAYAITGVGQVVLTRVPNRAAAVVLPAEADGVYAIVSVASGQVVARIDKHPGEPRRVTLPTGRYVVRKLGQSSVLVGELDLVRGGDRRVDDAQLQAVTLGDPLARGGWARRQTTLAVHFLGAPPFASANPAQWGGVFEMRRSFRPRLHGLIGVSASTGTRTESLGKLRTHQFTASLGLLAMRPFRHVDLGLSGGLSAVLVRQEISWLQTGPDGTPVEDDEWRMAVAPGVWGGGRLRVPLRASLGIEAGIRATLFPARTDVTSSVHVLGEGRLGLSLIR